VLRIGKLTDYGLVLLSELAICADSVSARDLSERTKLPQPTVAKVLKALSRGGLLHASRGAGGGYRLARPAEDITVAHAIEVLEGPLTLAACVSERCAHEGTCRMRGPWERINRVVDTALRAVTLREIAGPVLADVET